MSTSLTSNDFSWPEGGPTQAEFTACVWQKGKQYYRDLPWRHIDDPYAVMVSECMLQQTQVKRVLNFWPRFMATFPTIDALAAANQSDVLRLWKGLGYNRRAQALKRCADICSAHSQGRLPQTVKELRALPGIGEATAAGIMAFAYQKPAVYLETNVRSVFIYELFPKGEAIHDRVLKPLVKATCSSEDPRGWYYALLDYGAALKSHGVNPARRSATYHRQSPFEGSRRQKRSWIVQYVLDAPEGVAADVVLAALNEAEAKARRGPVEGALFDSIVADLLAEGFFRRQDDLLVP